MYIYSPFLTFLSSNNENLLSLWGKSTANNVSSNPLDRLRGLMCLNDTIKVWSLITVSNSLVFPETIKKIKILVRTNIYRRSFVNIKWYKVIKSLNFYMLSGTKWGS